MKKLNDIFYFLLFGVAFSILPCSITYWISNSYIYTLLLFLIIFILLYLYVRNNKNKKVPMSIYKEHGKIYFMLNGNDWSNIQINNNMTLAQQIIDRLTVELTFLKNSISNIEFVNIEEKGLKEQANRLLV